MAVVSGFAIASRLRQAGEARTGATRLLLEGARLALLTLGGSALVALLLQFAFRVAGKSLADPLDLPSYGASSPLATWGFVLFQSSLLPHALPGSAWTMWGAGSLVLTVVVLVAGFRAGRAHAHRALDVILVALPSLAPAALVAGAELALGGSSNDLLLSLAAPLPVAAAVWAGAAWRELRDERWAAPAMRALLAAAYAVPTGIGLAALPMVVAPAGREPGGMWVWVLLPYVPNAVLRGALDGYGLANSVGLLMLVLGATAIGLHLSRRSFLERALYAVAVAALLVAGTVAATPVSGWSELQTAEHALSPALLVGIVAAAAGPLLGGLRLGHSIARVTALRAIGDLLPAPAASEISALDTLHTPRPAAAPSTPARRATARLTLQQVARLAVGGATLAVMLLAATVAFTVLNSGTPSQAPSEAAVASEYLAALGSGDADRAWSLTTIDSSGVPTAAAPRLLGRDDLARMLRLDGNRLGAPFGARFDVVEQSALRATVRARYSDAAGPHDQMLVLRLLSGAWKVQVVPAGLLLPAAATAQVTIDGAPVSVGVMPVAVLPGAHVVSVTYPAPFLTAQATVTADRPYVEPVAVPVGARLDDAGMAAARTAVIAALRACASASGARPTGCPQAIDAPAGSPVLWTVVGDPAQSLVVLPDERGGVVAHGQYQMVGAYNVHVPEDVKRLAAGGAFRVPLSWSGGRWSVAGSVDPDSADVARPPATDADLLAAVRGGFYTCAVSPLLRPADCPQTVASQLFVKDVAWKLSGDPLAGAAVSFDAHRGVFSVSGTYAMNVSYVEGGDAKSAQSSGRYRADLFWDGQRSVLVAINRA